MLVLTALLLTLLSACDGTAREPRLASSPPVQTSAPFSGSIRVIDSSTLKSMGTSWMPGCPVPRHDLRVVRVSHWGFDGVVHNGDLIVNESQAANVLRAFRQIYKARFPIQRIVIADGYIGDVPRRALPNATSGFNCRRSVGRPSAWSQHAYGLAIDINPVQNPRVTAAGTIPVEGAAYVDRANVRPGMILPGDAVVRAFAEIGWTWGGTYTRTKDYHHFSLRGL